MQRDVQSQKAIEGHIITEIECGNCGAEFKFAMVIENGPTRKHVVNGTSEEMAKQMPGGR